MILDTNAISALFHDVWIAALARQHGEPVVSRDGHFDQVAKLKRHAW